MTRPPSPPDDPAPDPDAEPTAGEKAQARGFGDLLAKALSGQTPPAMATGDRELLEAAMIIRAVANPAELTAARASGAVEAALRQAAGGVDRPSVSAPDIVPPALRPRTRAPWLIATVSTAVAAAAIFVLVTGIGGARRAGDGAPARGATATALPDHWRSRPADDLIGAIPAERSGDAVTRIDAIFADRLGGFRDRTLAGRTRQRSTP